MVVSEVKRMSPLIARNVKMKSKDKVARNGGPASQVGVDICVRVAGRGASRKIICAGFELK